MYFPKFKQGDKVNLYGERKEVVGEIISLHSILELESNPDPDYDIEEPWYKVLWNDDQGVSNQNEGSLLPI